MRHNIIFKNPLGTKTLRNTNKVSLPANVRYPVNYKKRKVFKRPVLTLIKVEINIELLPKIL